MTAPIGFLQGGSKFVHLGGIAFYGTTGRSIGLKALPFGLLQYRSRNIAPLLRLYLTGSGNQW